MSADSIPKTDSIKALARFWDTHDLTDFEVELEPIEGQAFARGAVVRVPLSPTEVEAVKRMAQSEGVPLAELISKWVRERVKAS
jgi:predicted DNA binding CopG/RHH family protein